MGSKILVIGDALEDIHYICNKPTRRSAETGNDIYDIVDVRVDPGGAANVVRSLQNLGLHVDFLYGINANMGVPQKCRIYKDKEQVLRFDLNDKVQALWMEFLEPALEKSYKAIVVADYGKGTVDDKVREAIINYSQKFACPLFVNTKSNPVLWWTPDNKRTVLFCNVSEWERYAKGYNMFSLVVRTDGEHGVQIITEGKIAKEVPALAPRVIDVNGAGDVFLAAYVARALGTELVNQHLPSALAFASVAAAIAIQRPYTSYIEFQELKEGWYEYNNSGTTNKGHNRESLGNGADCC